MNSPEKYVFAFEDGDGSNKMVLGGKGSWSSLFDLLPDVAMWLILSATLSLMRGAAKVMILKRPTTSRSS